MTPVHEQIATTPQRRIPWVTLAWFGGLLIACYGPILWALVRQWNNDADMGHGFFVPWIAGWIVWQKLPALAAEKASPNWWGLAIVIYGGLQLYVATLGAEVFLSRTALVITLIGMVLLLGGTRYLRSLAFPLFLLFFMIPIPAIIYNKITFPLQFLASELANWALDFMNIPVLREGNILHLSETTLSVVEACSGIRSLLSLTFLALVYGYFFESSIWMRVVLFVATVPIAMIANASRVTLTGILSEHDPKLAEGFFHTASGWVIFMVALAALLVFHQGLRAASRFLRRGKAKA